MDEELDAAIRGQADLAEETAPELADLKALAVGLWEHFDGYSIEEIEEKLKEAWRDRGLYWKPTDLEEE